VNSTSLIGSICNYLPHAVAIVKHGDGYYYLLCSYCLCCLVGIMLFVDIIAGEPIPQISPFKTLKLKKS